MADDSDWSAHFKSLESSLRHLERSIHSVENNIEIRINHVSDRVDTVISISADLQTDLHAVRQVLDSFVKEQRLARNVQIAQAGLIDVRAELDRKFGHHETVRRNTIGMLQAMDAGIVTQDTLQQAGEELMIDVPQYWLAPVLVALAAWIRDSRPLAEAALRVAMVRDANKTALFFSLVLARYERYIATDKWIFEYVDRQDSNALSREFTVVLDAVAQGALGPKARRTAKDCCRTWFYELSQATPKVEEQQARWLNLIERQRTQLGGEFTLLPDICPSWPGLISWLESATVHAGAEKLLRARLAETSVRYSDLRNGVDSILTRLVTAYDNDETPLRRLERKWLAIIRHEGDYALANMALAAETPSPEPRINFLALLTDIGLHAREAEASVMTQQLAITMASDWIEAAAYKLTEKSRELRPEAVSVNINGWQHGLRPTDKDQEQVPLYNKYVDQLVHQGIQRINLHKQATALSASTAIMIFLLFAFLFSWFSSTVSMVLLSGAGLLLLSSFGGLFYGRHMLPGRKEGMRKWGAQKKDDGGQKIRLALDEIRELFEKWETELAKESSLVDFIQGERVRANQADIGTINDSSSKTEPRLHPQDDESVAGAQQATHTSAQEQEQSDAASQPMALRLPDWNLLPPVDRGASDKR